MSILKRSAPLLILAGGLALAIAIANGKPDPAPSAAPPNKPPQVEVITLQPQTTVLSLKTEGTIRPKRDISLVAEVSGRIQSVTDDFADGATVSRGALLVQIDPADYETEVMRARARVADAEQALALEKGRARQARREWRDLGSPEANDLFLRKPQIKSAEAGLSAARADLRSAEANLARTQIRAPFDGRLYDLQANLGQYVSPGTPIAGLFDSSIAEIALPLSERQLRLLDLPLSPDQPIEATVRARFGQQLRERRGALVRHAAQLDADTRQLSVMVELEKPFSGPQALYAGQFVEVSLPSKALENVIVIPHSTLHPRDTLWFLDDQQKLRIREVDVLQAVGDKVAVQLPDNQPLRLVTSYLANPVEGMALLPEQASRQAAKTASQQP